MQLYSFSSGDEEHLAVKFIKELSYPKMDLFWEVFISRSTKIVAHGSGFARINSKQEVLKPNQ